jgi:hypothetical protein
VRVAQREQCRQPRFELVTEYRLANEVVRAGDQNLGAHPEVGVARDDDDRDVVVAGIGAQPARHLEAVGCDHVKVEHEAVGVVMRAPIETFQRRAEAVCGRVGEPLDDVAQREQRRCAIVDDDYVMDESRHQRTPFAAVRCVHGSKQAPEIRLWAGFAAPSGNRAVCPRYPVRPSSHGSLRSRSSCKRSTRRS